MIVSEKVEEPPVCTYEVHTDEVVVIHEETINEKGEVREVEITEKIHDGVVEEVNLVVIQDEVTEVTQPVEAPKSEAKEKEGERPKTRKYDRPYRGKDNREDKDNREKGEYRANKGEYRGNNNRGEYRGKREGDDRRPYYKEGGDKKSYKPKYQEKDQNRNNNQNDDYSSSDE